MSALSRRVRAAAAATMAAGWLLVIAGPAAAHVGVDGEIAPGGNGTFTFTVPNERDDATTTKIEVSIPDEAPLGSLRVQPKPGWSVTTTTRTLDEPVEVFGNAVTEVIDTITWTADGPGIGPDQFDTFTLRGGPFPEDAESVVFPAVQTYDSGEEVAWIEETIEGQDEPEHPAPVLTLTVGVGADEDHDEADDDTATTEDTTESTEEAAGDLDAGDDDGTDGLAVAGVIAGLGGIATGGVAIALARRRPA